MCRLGVGSEDGLRASRKVEVGGWWGKGAWELVRGPVEGDVVEVRQ